MKSTTSQQRLQATVIRARIDRTLKDQASRVLDAMGLTVSDVLRELMVQIATDKKLPFRVRTALAGIRETTLATLTEQQFWAHKQALQASDRAKAIQGTLAPEETVMIRARTLRGATPQWPADAFSECEVPFE